MINSLEKFNGSLIDFNPCKWYAMSVIGVFIPDAGINGKQKRFRVISKLTSY